MERDRSKLVRAVEDPRRAWYYCMTRMKGRWYEIRYAGRRRFSCGVNFRVRDALVLSGPGVVRFGDDVLLEGGAIRANTFFTYGERSSITVGSHSYLDGVRIGCRDRIAVGNRCIIADARITDNDDHSVLPDRWNPDVEVKTAPVVIEDNVWICMEAIVLKGVRIGRNSVVAAGAVVSRDVPPNSVVAGNPASVVKTFSDAEVAAASAFFSSHAKQYPDDGL